jgi:hypothetical protein
MLLKLFDKILSHYLHAIRVLRLTNLYYMSPYTILPANNVRAIWVQKTSLASLTSLGNRHPDIEYTSITSQSSRGKDWGSISLQVASFASFSKCLGCFQRQPLVQSHVYHILNNEDSKLLCAIHTISSPLQVSSFNCEGSSCQSPIC